MGLYDLSVLFCLICGAIGNFKGRLKIGFQTALAFQCLFRLLRNIALYGICSVAEEVLFHLLGRGIRVRADRQGLGGFR